MRVIMNYFIISLVLMFIVGGLFTSNDVVSAANTPLVKASGTYKTTTKLNVRTGNGTNYKTVGSLKKGQTIKVNAKRGNWYRFKYKGKNRYVSGNYLKKQTKAKTATKKKTNTPLVKASGTYKTTAKLNVRTGNGTNYKTVGSLKKGQTIKVNAKRGNWYRFKYKGKNRYVSGNYLKKQTKAKTTTNVKNTTNNYKVNSVIPIRFENESAYKTKKEKDFILKVKKETATYINSHVSDLVNKGANMERFFANHPLEIIIQDYAKAYPKTVGLYDYNKSGSKMYIRVHMIDGKISERAVIHELGHHIGYTVAHPGFNYTEFGKYKNINLKTNSSKFGEWANDKREMFADAHTEAFLNGFTNRTATGNWSSAKKKLNFINWEIKKINSAK